MDDSPCRSRVIERTLSAPSFGHHWLSVQPATRSRSATRSTTAPSFGIAQARPLVEISAVPAKVDHCIHSARAAQNLASWPVESAIRPIKCLPDSVRHLRRGAATADASRAGRSGQPTRRGFPRKPLRRVGLRHSGHVIHSDVENDSSFHQLVHRLRRSEPPVDCTS